MRVLLVEDLLRRARSYQPNLERDGHIWAGYRIGPFEVESALVEHPAVVEAAVIASPDPVSGEIVNAFVMLAPGYAASEELAALLQEHVRR